MTIPLRLGQDGQQSSRAAAAKAMEHDILAIRSGDWDAKNRLFRSFNALLSSLAEKRSHDPGQVAGYIEAGRAGLLKAVRKYKPGAGVEKFRLSAVDFIEAAMDDQSRGRRGILKRFLRSS